MNVYIIDDEQANREILQILIQRYYPEIRIIGESEKLDVFLNSTNLQQQTDLLFLDILMPDSTGFDLLNQLANRTFEVILVTGFDEFAIQAFEYSVIDYVLKPIDKDRFCSAVEKAKKRVLEKQILESAKSQLEIHAKIAVIKNKRTHYIESSDVSYMIGKSGGYTTIFCKNGDFYILSRSLNSVQNECFEIPYLIRASQSVIINLDDIVTCEQGGSGYIGLKTNDFEVFRIKTKFWGLSINLR
ncbi:LytR/AlgR family response regulator transcription factor [Fluviicola taffensis]|uniref:Response regulator receiver protein n=1 Tax=Fluviicola taffensis (strain DSM 16823 / NCIMB 13979 / RW262) TaxID=755732 RepID=F2IG34_FLUTR|nr:LytTR family DNA-binding domain-containing protein [Fluviicola taffensis]AEA44669.1 response regulator receiver protein [Fluviicola taffensis DSM 16823]